MLVMLASVIAHNQSSFDPTKTQFVKFFAPWCGHCKALAPDYEKFSDISPYETSEIDCTENTDLCAKYGVNGYPALKFFHNGEVYDFDGARTPEAMLQFTEDMQGDVLISGRVHAGDKFIYTTNSLHNDQPLFTGLKGKVKVEVASGPQKLTYKNLTFTGKFTPKNIKAWALSVRHGSFPALGPTNYQDLTLKTLALYAHETGENVRDIAELIENVTMNVNFASVDAGKWNKFTEEFNCTKPPCALVMIGSQKFGQEIETPAQFLEFVEMVQNGIVQPIGGSSQQAKEELLSKYEEFITWVSQFSQIQQAGIVGGITMLIGLFISIPIVICVIKCCSTNAVPKAEEKSEGDKVQKGKKQAAADKTKKND